MNNDDDDDNAGPATWIPSLYLQLLNGPSVFQGVGSR